MSRGRSVVITDDLDDDAIYILDRVGRFVRFTRVEDGVLPLLLLGHFK